MMLGKYGIAAAPPESWDSEYRAGPSPIHFKKLKCYKNLTGYPAPFMKPVSRSSQDRTQDAPMGCENHGS